MEKPKGWGYETPDSIVSKLQSGTYQSREDGLWEPAKTLPYYSLRERIKFAWDVFRYRAEPLYWYFPKDSKFVFDRKNNK